MIKGTTRLQRICWIVFLFYIVGLLYFTIFAEAFGRAPGDTSEAARYNLVPFNEIKRFIMYRKQLGMKAFMLNVVGNVAAFIPAGFMLPAISRRSRRLVGLAAVGFMLSFFIECTQIVFRAGSFDVDDLMLNTLGAVLGFMLNRLVQKHRIRKKRKKKPDVVVRKINGD